MRRRATAPVAAPTASRARRVRRRDRHREHGHKHHKAPPRRRSRARRRRLNRLLNRHQRPLQNRRPKPFPRPPRPPNRHRFLSPTPEPAPIPEPTPEPAPAPSTSGLLGRLDRQAADRHQAPWDMNAVTKFEQLAGKTLSLVNFSAPFANCSHSALLLLRLPHRRRWRTSASTARSRSSAGARNRSPSSLNEPNFQLSDVIAGSYDSYIREFADRRQGLGPPLLPPLQLGDERQLVPLVGGRQRQQDGRVRRRLAPRARHLHRRRRDQRDLGLVPERRSRQAVQNLASLYPGDDYVDWTGLDGYNWGTNPARPDRWPASTSSTARPTTQITGTIAPSKPLMIGEVGSTEYGGSKATWISDMLSEIPTDYPKIRGLLWFDKYRRRHGLADRDLEPAPPAPSPPGSRTRPTRATNSASLAFGRDPAAELNRSTLSVKAARTNVQ